MWIPRVCRLCMCNEMHIPSTRYWPGMSNTVLLVESSCHRTPLHIMTSPIYPLAQPISAMTDLQVRHKNPPQNS
jgi:hypothetical protein